MPLLYYNVSKFSYYYVFACPNKVFINTAYKNTQIHKLITQLSLAVNKQVTEIHIRYNNQINYTYKLNNKQQINEVHTNDKQINYTQIHGKQQLNEIHAYDYLNSLYNLD
jgi:hypothetical protein